MDVLDEILSSLRLSGGIVFDAAMRGDWCVVSQFSPEHCAPYFPVPQQIISYHYVRRGRIFTQLDGQACIECGEGSMILLPRNDVHQIFSRPGLEPTDIAEYTRPGTDGVFNAVEYDGGGEEISIFCGWLGVSSGNHPLLDVLPQVLVVDGSGNEWMTSSLEYAASELRDNPSLVAKLSEVFFAQAVRRYFEGMRADEGGWLAGLRDPAVARALAMIHRRFAEELEVDDIAREAGVSRTVLGERFVELLGEPPMRYCARWRMRQAANMLRDGRHNNANIAYAVGFNSEAAFNRAFKREFGDPPATWKRRADAEQRAREQPTQLTELPPQTVEYAHAQDGTRLAYSCIGEGPALVKTANWLNHLEFDFESPIWRGWIRELSSDFRLIRYDERGNGLSDWNTPELSLDAFVDDLACVADAAGAETFDLLGISQGASVAIAYSLKHPERVRRMVLLGGYAAGWRARGDNEEISRREAMLTLTELGWGKDNPAYRQMFTSFYVPGANKQQMSWFNELQRRSTSPKIATRLMRVLSAIDVRPLLEQVRHPTLVLHATGDQAIPISAGEELARCIPGARFVSLESDNHILLEGEPAFHVFLDETRRFLSNKYE